MVFTNTIFVLHVLGTGEKLQYIWFLSPIVWWERKRMIDNIRKCCSLIWLEIGGKEERGKCLIWFTKIPFLLFSHIFTRFVILQWLWWQKIKHASKPLLFFSFPKVFLWAEGKGSPPISYIPSYLQMYWSTLFPLLLFRFLSFTFLSS